MNDRREEYRKHCKDFAEWTATEEGKQEAIRTCEGMWESLSPKEKLLWIDGMGFTVSMLQSVVEKLDPGKADELGAMFKMRADEIREAIRNGENPSLKEVSIPFFTELINLGLI